MTSLEELATVGKTGGGDIWKLRRFYILQI